MTDFEKTKEEILTSHILQGQQAEAVLSNPMFHRFFEEYKNQLIDNLVRTKGDAVEKREEFYRQLKSLGIMRAKLTIAIQTGKMDIEELSRLQKLAKLAKTMIG